jgi:hypothetical protein
LIRPVDGFVVKTEMEDIMGWDDSIVSDPPNYSKRTSGSINSTYAVGWNFWTNNDTALFKFSSFADDLTITLQLFNDEQTNTQPFDQVSFDIGANSPPVFWQYTGFPPRGDGTPKDNFRFSISCVKLTNTSRTCANYDLLTPQ